MASLTCGSNNSEESPNPENNQLLTSTFANPVDLVTDSNGNIFLSDNYNHLIRKIEPNGNVTNYSGILNHPGYQNGQRNSAKFRYPAGLLIDNNGDLLIADHHTHSIRKIDTNGIVTTFAGTGNQGYIDGLNSTAKFGLRFTPPLFAF